MDVWKSQKIVSDQCMQGQIGPLRLWLKQADDELRIAVERIEDTKGILETRVFEPIKGSEPEDLDWGRWVVSTNADTIKLIPLTPDRPLVVRPEVPLKIPTNHEALFFVSFPIWVRIVAGKSKQLNLYEVPSVVLSNIWFGDPMSGELCYSLRSRARRKINDSEPSPHRVICPVRIRNSSTKQLNVERFCVHVEHLKIYDGSEKLWTNEISITFKGESEVSQVQYAQSPPTFEPVQHVISEARIPLKKPLLKKSLSDFKLFSGA
jgi:hypothetical protein